MILYVFNDYYFHSFDLTAIYEQFECFQEYIIVNNLNYFQTLDLLSLLLERDTISPQMARLYYLNYVDRVVNSFQINHHLFPDHNIIFNISNNLQNISPIRELFADHGLFVYTGNFFSGVFQNFSLFYSIQDDLNINIGNNVQEFVRNATDFASRYQNNPHNLLLNFDNLSTINSTYNNLFPVFLESVEYQQSIIFEFLEYIHNFSVIFVHATLQLHTFEAWGIILGSMATFFRLNSELELFLEDPQMIESINLVVDELIRLLSGSC